LSFGLVIVLARQLGPTVFGDYSLALNVGMVALVAIEGGYPLLLYRETAAASKAFLPWQGRLLPLAIGYALAVVLALAIIPIGFWLGHSFGVWWAVLLCMALVAWSNTYSGFLRGKGLFLAEARWQIAGRAFSLGAILVALALGAKSVTEIFFAWSFGLLVLIGLRAQHRPPLPTFELASPVRITAFHLMIGQLVFVVLLRFDLLALAAIGEESAQIAHYSAVVRFAEAGFLLFSPIVNVLQLGLRQRLSHRADFGPFVLKMSLTAFVFALIGTLVGEMAAPWLVTLAFGQEYSEAAPLLGWVLSVLILLLPNQVLAQAAIALGFEKTVWVAYILGLLAAWVSAVALVPNYGALGIAWAMLIGHGSVLMVFAFSLLEHLKSPNWN
jgi:O-antigen/teichoic acid export membrane protein